MSEDRIDWQQRTGLLLGEEKMERLRNAHVLVVGAYAAEMLCRAGVGRMTIVDADTVQPTNINRQLPALHSTLGKPKAEVLAERFRDINPDVRLTVLPVYLKDEAIPELLDNNRFDFIVDAIDTVSPKCYLIYHALRRGIKIVCSMGAGAKSDITQVRFADLWETYYPSPFCRPVGDLSLRIEQGGTETLAEDGREAESPRGVQYRTGRPECGGIGE